MREPVKTKLYEDINLLKTDLDKFESKIKKINAKFNNSHEIELSAEEFLNFTNSIADKMRKVSNIEKDTLAQIMLLNIYIDNKNPFHLEGAKVLLKPKSQFWWGYVDLNHRPRHYQ